MINKVMSSIVPKAAMAPKAAGGKGSLMTRFLQSETLGKVLESAADNPVIFQSAFSLALCCGARPATNFLVTEDKQDATYASCHSISSGVIGFVWPLIFATPLSVGVKRVLKNPQKYLKPEVVKKFYPNVGIVDVIGKDGKKIGEKIRTNVDGKMLRKDGSVLCQDYEPLLVKQDKDAFEAANKSFYVDEGGVVRSKTVFSTKGGKVELDKNGNKIGCAVQSDMTPITETMKIGAKKESNVKNIINMVPDILLAPPRAALTIALIPPILRNVFHVQKSNKGAQPEQAKPAAGLDVTSKSNNTVAQGNPKAAFNTFTKGGK